MSQILKAACAEKGITLDEATLTSLADLATTHPILQSIITWVEGLLPKTPAVIPYIPQILADLKSTNWIAALTLIGDVLAGITPTTV